MKREKEGSKERKEIKKFNREMLALQLICGVYRDRLSFSSCVQMTLIAGLVINSKNQINKKCKARDHEQSELVNKG